MICWIGIVRSHDRGTPRLTSACSAPDSTRTPTPMAKGGPGGRGPVGAGQSKSTSAIAVSTVGVNGSRAELDRVGPLRRHVGGAGAHSGLVEHGVLEGSFHRRLLCRHQMIIDVDSVLEERRPR